MDTRLIAVASPIFFVLIFAERWLLRRRTEPVYRLWDSIADLSCGVGEQVVQVFTFVLELALYGWVFSRLRVHTFSIRSVGAWVLLVLLLDLAYYAFHRASHRVNFLWAVHAVHHQSEEYNLAVALRQGWLEPLMIAPFHVPIALLGFPPEMFFIAFTAHTLWQFWPHTRGIGRLSIDGLLNSPSNHRCHHAVNPEYIDKNYSGLFIVWDRLFGTWAREGEEPAYGTVKPLASFNPLWANVSYWTEMLALARRCPRLVDKLSVPLRPPEWRPKALGGPVAIPPATRATQQRYEVRAPRAVGRYALASFVVLLLAQPALTQAPRGGPWLPKLALALLLVATLVTVAGLVERRRWAVGLEVLRLAAIVPVVWLFARATPHASALVVGAAALAAAQAVGLALASRVSATTA